MAPSQAETKHYEASSELLQNLLQHKMDCTLGSTARALAGPRGMKVPGCVCAPHSSCPVSISSFLQHMQLYGPITCSPTVWKTILELGLKTCRCRVSSQLDALDRALPQRRHTQTFPHCWLGRKGCCPYTTTRETESYSSKFQSSEKSCLVNFVLPLNIRQKKKRNANSFLWQIYHQEPPILPAVFPDSHLMAS